ncbi:MAG TPA: protein kinase [Urbifossiella sp.]|jgi:hypothetical protein|nr:protein kinase [Urbifossiella sp.]
MTRPSETRPLGEPNWDRLRARAAAVADPLTVVREDQAARWGAGARLPVEAYRDNLPGLTDEDVLVLIVGEATLRREAGESPAAGEYQTRFPHLADDVAVQFQFLAADSTQDGAGRSSVTREILVLPRAFGRYRLLAEIGRGGMGTVYLAHDGELDRRVALKIPRFGQSRDPRAAERFRREAQAAAGINHPNLCPVFDIGRTDGLDYFTMPYLEGESLAAMIARAAPLPLEDAVRLIRQIAAGLEAAHAVGVVHRDLKPSNILLGAGGAPVVMDFGLARRVGPGAPTLTDEGAVIGTAAYLPPEQIGCDPEAMGPRCDVYGLGIILYELLTGRVPFVGTPAAVLQKVLAEEPASPAALRPGLDPRVAAVCLKAIAKEPARRFASMGDFVRALDDAAASVAAPGRVRIPSRRTAAAATVVLVGAGVGMAAWHIVRRTDPTPVAEQPVPAPDVPAAATPHPLIRGSEWTGRFTFRSAPPAFGTASLRVTEQDGAAFKGVYATEGGRFAWGVVGSAGNGAVQWELKTALTPDAETTGATGFATIKGTYTDRALTVVYDDFTSRADMTLTRTP